MINMSKFLFVVTLFFALPADADSVAGGGSGGASGATSSNADKNMGCAQAGALRLVLASVAHSCQAAESAKGGPAPQDNMGCGAPSLSSTSSGLAKYTWGGAANASGSTMSVPSGLDCSGFVCAASCRSGIPIKPGNACAVIRTSEMDQLLSSGQSCYKPIDQSKKSGQSYLTAGDLVEYQHGGGSGGHTFAIERVDPNDCHKLCIIQEEGSKTGGFIQCTGGATGDAQGMALDDVVKANCSGSSSSSAQTKIMTYDSAKSGCQPQPAKQISNGQNCDVGNMPNG